MTKDLAPSDTGTQNSTMLAGKAARAMSRSSLILRESALSAVINAVLSVVFFSIAARLKPEVAPVVFASDFPVQTFMVALMGSLAPGLLATRREPISPRRVIVRSIVAAVAGAALLGGGAWAIARALPSPLPLALALAIKALYGALLGVAATQFQLRAILSHEP